MDGVIAAKYKGDAENSESGHASIETVPGLGDQPVVNLDGILHKYPALQDHNVSAAQRQTSEAYRLSGR